MVAPPPSTTTTMAVPPAQATYHDPAACPVLTTVDKSVEELVQPDYPEIK